MLWDQQMGFLRPGNEAILILAKWGPKCSHICLRELHRVRRGGLTAVKRFSHAQYIFRGTLGFPVLAPLPPAARLTLESYPLCFFSSLHLCLKKHPASSAWFLVFPLGLLPRRKDTFSHKLQASAANSLWWLCGTFRMRVESEGDRRYD